MGALATLAVAGAFWTLSPSDSESNRSSRTVAASSPYGVQRVTSAFADEISADDAAPLSQFEDAIAADTDTLARGRLWAPVGKAKSLQLHASPDHIHGENCNHDAAGRSVRFNASTLASLSDLQPGQPVSLPLMDGRTALGNVGLVQADADWVRVGGALTGAHAGTFTLSTNGDQVAGLVILENESLAYQIAQDDAGVATLTESAIDNVLCTPMPVGPEDVQSVATLVPQAAGAAAGLTGTGDSVPLLSSRPNATAVIYIDFDGETVTDPLWNNGKTIHALPANISASQIIEVWNIVKEDYAAFNIDVTTNVARYNSAPVGRRMRCIVTPTTTARPGAGGVAYVNSFRQAGTLYSSTIPCWVFNTGAKYVAEAVSHEVGHTLGLRHDGRTGEDYYMGHGSGSVSWAPIMGASYYRNVTQWSKGEYANANRFEDDIEIIGGSLNGFGFVTDTAGNSRGSASNLSLSGSSINQSGIIVKSSDADYYRFTLGSPSSITLAASPAALAPNLDISLQLQDANGNTIAADNDDRALDARLSTNLSAGTYYVRIAGSGRGSAMGDGYTAYGSQGAYTITGTVSGAAQAPSISGLSNKTITSGSSLAGMPFTVSDGDTPTSALTVSGQSSNTSLIPSSGISFGGSGSNRTISVYPASGKTGSATITVTVSDGALTGSASFTVTVNASTSAPSFSSHPSSQTTTVGGNVTFTAAASGNPSPSYQWLRNGSTISGATSATLTLTNVDLGDAGTYSVRASNGSGSVTSNGATLTVNNASSSSLLTGAIIGSAPYGGQSSYAAAAAFDGSTSTFFAGNPAATPVRVGRDFGTGRVLERIRFFPRSGYAHRMTGGLFRGANQPDLSDSVTLATITSTPPSGTWSEIAVTSTKAYRYVYFTTSPLNEANVAELEFHGSTAVVAAPKITGQPASLTVTAGSSATFNVTTSTAGATFQWRKNGVAISGATSATYRIESAVTSDAGTYTVVVSNSGGSATSNGALLTVQPGTAPSGLLTGSAIGSAPYGGDSQYGPARAFDGATGTFFAGRPSDSFVYVGRDFGSAQTVTRIRFLPRSGFGWRMGGGRFMGSNNADLSGAVVLHTISGSPDSGLWHEVNLANTLAFRYVFFTTSSQNEANVSEIQFYGSNGGGGNSGTGPAISGQPQSRTVTEGDSVTFTVTASGASGYQWRLNGVAIPGATSATLSIGTVLAEDAGSYTVVVSNSAGSVTSDSATLTVNRVSGPVLLSGTAIGSTPYNGESQYSASRAFDGGASSFFAGRPSDSFVYVGMDLGTARKITRVRYLPRNGFPWRMNGGQFRGSNNADLSNSVLLHAISGNPANGVWADVTLPASGSTYRYVFFTTSSSNEANVAELEFFGQ